MTSPYTAQVVLDTKMHSDDVDGVETIRDYLKKLLETLWAEGERFSGKRPFGSSGWEYDIYAALVKAKIIKGTLDEYDYVETCDTENANRLIFSAIKALR